MQVIIDYKEYEKLKDIKQRSSFNYIAFMKYSTKLEQYLRENIPDFNINHFMTNLEKAFPGEFTLKPVYKKSGDVTHYIAPVLITEE